LIGPEQLSRDRAQLDRLDFFRLELDTAVTYEYLDGKPKDPVLDKYTRLYKYLVVETALPHGIQGLSYGVFSATR